MPTPEEAENDARNAELEWSARERSPSPPKERFSWASCQAASVTSAARQAEKQDLVSPSKARRASEDRLGGVVLKMWTSLQKPPQIQSNENATWRSESANSTRTDSSFLA